MLMASRYLGQKLRDLAISAIHLLALAIWLLISSGLGYKTVDAEFPIELWFTSNIDLLSDGYGTIMMILSLQYL